MAMKLRDVLARAVVGCLLVFGMPLAARASDDPVHTEIAPAGDVAAHDAEASHGDDAHAQSDPSPLAWDTDLAIWTGAVFLVLFGILYRFAWGPIREGLDRREQRITDDIAAAQRTNQEARELLVQYEQKLSDSQNEVRAILEEARRDAEHTQREILEKAAGEADVVRDRAKREIETATAQALKELAETSSQLAVGLAGKILSAELDTRKHSGLIQEAMSSFPKGGPGEN